MRRRATIFQESWSISLKIVRLALYFERQKFIITRTGTGGGGRSDTASPKSHYVLRLCGIIAQEQNVFVRCSCLAAERQGGGAFTAAPCVPAQAVEISWNFLHPSPSIPLITAWHAFKNERERRRVLIMNPFSTHHTDKCSDAVACRVCVSVCMFYPQKHWQEATTSKSHPFLPNTLDTLSIPPAASSRSSSDPQN